MFLKMKGAFSGLWVVSDLRVHVNIFLLVDGVMSSYKAVMAMLILGEKGLLSIVLVHKSHSTGNSPTSSQLLQLG